MFFRGHLDKSGLGSCLSPPEVGAMPLAQESGPYVAGIPVLWSAFYNYEDLEETSWPTDHYMGPLYLCSSGAYPILFVRFGDEVKVLFNTDLSSCERLGTFPVLSRVDCSVESFPEIELAYMNTYEYHVFKVPISLLSSYATGVTHIFQSLRTVLRFADGSIRSLGPEITQAPPWLYSPSYSGCDNHTMASYTIPYTTVNYSLTIPDNVEYVFDYISISGIFYCIDIDAEPGIVLCDPTNYATHDYLIYTLRDDTFTITTYFASTTNNGSPVQIHTSDPLLNVRSVYGYSSGSTGIIGDCLYLYPDRAVLTALCVDYSDSCGDNYDGALFTKRSDDDIFEKYRAVVGINSTYAGGCSFNLMEIPHIVTGVNTESTLCFKAHAFLYHTDYSLLYSFPVPIVDGHPPLYIGNDGSIYYAFHRLIYDIESDVPYQPVVRTLSDGSSYKGVGASPGPSPAILTDDNCLIVAFQVASGYFGHTRGRYYGRDDWW